MAKAPSQTTSCWLSLPQFFALVAPEYLAARRGEFIADVIAERRRYRAIEVTDFNGVRGPAHDSLPKDHWRVGEIVWHWSTLIFGNRSFYIEVLVEAPPLPIEESPPVKEAPPSVLLIEEAVEEAPVSPINPMERPQENADQVTQLEWGYLELRAKGQLIGLRGKALLREVCKQVGPNFSSSQSSLKTAKRRARLRLKQPKIVT